MIDVNVKGALYSARAALPWLIKSRVADLVTVASEAGRRGLPFEATYCASKFAQVGLTSALDHELREQGVRCTSICPGGVATDFAMGHGRTPDMPQLAGMMRPEDVAEAVLFVRDPTAQPPHPRGRLPAGDRDVVGLMAVASGAYVDERAALRHPLDRRHRRHQGHPGHAQGGPRRAWSPSVPATMLAARDVAARHGIERVHGSYEALLADPEVDAVYIPLPNHLHREWTIAAARAGKHVLCEKPLAMTAAEAEQMVAVCERAGVRLMEAFMYRLHPSWLAVREIVASGRIGRLLAVQSWFSYYNDDPSNIRNIRDVGGGALYDIGCYNVNLSTDAVRRRADRVAGSHHARRR